MFSIKRICLIILALIVLLIAWQASTLNSPSLAMSSADNYAANQSADAIVVSLSDAPRTLDPRFATDATSFYLSQLLFPAPVRFDKQGQPQAMGDSLANAQPNSLSFYDPQRLFTGLFTGPFTRLFTHSS